MERQNITLSMPKDVLRKAKVLAAQNNKSLSQLVRESLEETLRKSSGYKRAKDRQLKLLREGLDLGTRGNIKITREELHERR